MSEHPPITELVPHSAPTLVLDELIEWQDGHARTRATVRDEGPFVTDGRLDAVVLLEYMAQSVAACLGRGSWDAGAGVRVGMVVACRRMQLVRSELRAGEVLTIEVRRVHGADYVSHYDAEVRDEAESLLASATMTIVHGEQPPADASE